jgi:hypothetical protein
MPGTAVRAPILLHLRLKQMPSTFRKCVAGARLISAECGVVAIVVGFDHLERPTPFEHVPSQEILSQLVRQPRVSGTPKHRNGLPQGEIGRASKPMEAVKQASCVFYGLESLTEFAERLNGRIVQPGWALMIWVRDLLRLRV